jgi:signal transduction histidine kinase
MTERTRTRAPWIVWGVVVTLLLVTLALAFRNGSVRKDALIIGVSVVMMLGYLTTGAVVASRARNRLGWLMIAVGAGFLVTVLGQEAATYGLRTSPGSLPRLVVDAALIGDNVGFVAALFPIPMLLAVFPTGRVPSRRWRWFPPALSVGFALLAIGSILKAGPIDVNPGVQPQNPTGIPSITGAVNSISVIGGIATLVLSLLSVAILIVRFRASRGEERQQLRWLASVAALSLVAFVAAFVTSVGLGPNETTFLSNAAWFVLLASIGWGVPAAIGIALLRYRLWDLDVVVRKTVVATIVVVLITSLALLALTLVGTAFVGPVSDSSPSFLLAGIAVGLAFWPLRRFAKRISDRVVYGGRATPYDVLTEFSDRMSETYSTDDVLPRMAAIVADGTRAERVGVLVLVGREMQPAASWPAASAGEEPPATDLGEGSFEVRHHDELLGAITVSMPAADPMNPSKEKLIRDLASQAGLVLRNVRLIEELRASRRRIVTTQDERAKTLERNIHDGAQQQLVALAVKLRLAEGFARTDPERTASMLSDLQAEANDALENLRDLARGIYPPLLADRGLPAALEAQARKSAVPVDVQARGVDRYPQEIESAVYFSCLEALQNVAKYADASSASVELGHEDGHLTFRVTDDGRGFDATTRTYGTGLQGMADRLDSIGGTLEVTSSPGRGTTVAGRIPTPARD